jgi:type IV pili sensor histidine kinase/response regulator
MSCSVNLPLTSLLVFAALTAQCANLTQINRYATVANQPLPAQVNPLLAVQQVYFHHEIKTIGEALINWLRFSGFHLAASDKQLESLNSLLAQPLPQVDRNLGPLTVLDGLRVLVGLHEFEVIQDPLLREINFKRINPRRPA